MLKHIQKLIDAQKEHREKMSEQKFIMDEQKRTYLEKERKYIGWYSFSRDGR